MLSYQLAEFPVREAFGEAHRRFWNRLAAPGTWWSGTERVAIAAEARHAWGCCWCRARQSALTPAAVDGEHDHLNALPDVAVDVIHRVMTEPGRLSRKWFGRLLEAGLMEEQYIEIIGTLVALISIDRFCLGIGAPLHERPQPLAGEPSHYRPEGLTQGDTWVPMLAPDHNTGPEHDLFEMRPAGNVTRAMSLVLDEVRTLNDLGAVHYLRSSQVRGPSAATGALSRMQMEIIAFADAIVAADDHALPHIRHRFQDTMGAEAVVDAAGVDSNFERMVRIADSTGIPLDDRIARASQDVRQELDLERFRAFKESDSVEEKPRAI